MPAEKDPLPAEHQCPQPAEGEAPPAEEEPLPAEHEPSPAQTDPSPYLVTPEIMCQACQEFTAGEVPTIPQLSPTRHSVAEVCTYSCSTGIVDPSGSAWPARH